MRAVVVPRHGTADVLELHADWPDPGLPGPDEVLVAVEAAGVNPSDTKMRAAGAPLDRLPYVAGREAAGRVLAVGPGTSDLVEGDLVFAFFGWNARPGGHCELVVVPAAMVARRPPTVPAIQAAAVPLAGLTALQALARLRVPAGGRVVITGGSGGVGLFAVQLAARAGLEVVATTGPTNLGYVTALGASRTVDYHGGDAGEVFAHATHVLDLVGPANIDRYQDRLADGARLVAVSGLPDRLRTGLEAEAMRALPSAEGLDHLAGLLDSGRLQVDVTGVFPLAETATAHRLLEAGHVRGKLVVDVLR